ncbi:hypothetical protein HYALB_00000389 [Hymenoscyphus albidus]|uniref:NAD(P)-binding protein n=1 Tax=Hymenoscyphus albidus TaxID=595503 RepID=A0A9N9Q4V3_9HELO|nr:hypothetical protein HYALB_00000389 [Hymenoscyphus albidus]
MSVKRLMFLLGGASGIGLAIVELLAQSSNKFAILDISLAAAETQIRSLRSRYPTSTFSFYACDISNWEEQASAFKKAYRDMGSIDIVFANAGVVEIGHFLQTNNDEPAKPNLKTLDVNLVGTLYTVNLAVHYFRKNQAIQCKGSIICTSSNAGLYEFPFAPIHSASKHGVVGLVRSFAAPLEREGIQINCICPNVILMKITPMSVAMDAIVEFLIKPILTGRVAEISGDRFTFREAPEWVDAITKENSEAFWASIKGHTKELSDVITSRS